MDDRLSLKGAWLRHVTHFKFGVSINISQMAEARAVKFCRWAMSMYADFS